MTDQEQKVAWINATLGLVTLFLGELAPLSSPLFGISLPENSWLDILLVFSGLSLLACPKIIINVVKDGCPQLLKANLEIQAIGWLICFGKVKDNQMTAREINHWRFRCISLWRFESGLVVRNMKIEGYEHKLKLRLVFKRTNKATLQEFKTAIQTILSTFENDLDFGNYSYRAPGFLRKYPTAHAFQEIAEVQIQSPTMYWEVCIPINLLVKD